MASIKFLKGLMKTLSFAITAGNLIKVFLIAEGSEIISRRVTDRSTD